jgi:fimbrial isopeptide formation D2 family protein/uncharacterized repeat protein (TIGR01451 family)
MFTALFAFAVLGAGIAHADVEVTTDAVVGGDADTASWGQYVAVTLSYTNQATGQSASTIVPKIDLQSAEFSFVADSATITGPGGQLLTGSAANPTASGTQLSWNIDDLITTPDTLELAVGETVTIEFVITIGCAADTTQFLSSAALVRSVGGAVTEVGDPYTMTVRPPALILSVSPGNQAVALADGSQVDWTVTIQNSGLGNAYNLVASFGLDASLPYKAGSATVGTVSDGGTGTTSAGTSIDGGAVTIYTWRIGADASSDPDGGTGLDDLDNDGEYDDLPAGGTATITLSAQLLSCDPVGLYFDARCGFDAPAAACVATTDDGGTATGYVSTVPAQPSFTYVFSGLSSLDYCDGQADSTLTVTNQDGAGPVNDLQFAISSFTSGLDFQNLTTVLYDWDGTTATNPQTQTGSNAVTFDRTTGTFSSFPVIDGAKQLVVTFDAVWLSDANRNCYDRSFSNSHYVSPSYSDICGDTYSPTPSSITIGRTTPERLGLTTEHNGTLATFYSGRDDKVYISETGLEYNVSATLSARAGDPWSQLGTGKTTTMTFTYDADAFILVSTNPAYATHDAGTGTVTWSFTFTQGDPDFAASLVFDVKDRTIDPCEAGREFTHTFNVGSLELVDCLNCTYNLTRSHVLRGFINQDVTYAGSPIDGMDKTTAYLGTYNGGYGEACRNIRYTVTTDLGTGAPASWSGLPDSGSLDPGGTALTEVAMIERPLNGQTFSRLISVTYNGTNYGPSAFGGTDDLTDADVTTFGNGEVWLFLGDLDTGPLDPNDGGTLVVVWEFDPPTTFGTVAQFSEIRWPLADSQCGTEFGYEHGVWVGVSEQSNYITLPRTYDIRSTTATHSIVTYRNTSLHWSYDFIVTLDLDPDSDGLDYGYKQGTTVFSGFTDDTGATIAAFEPTVVGTTLVWDFRPHARVIRDMGTIYVDLLTSPCETDPSLSATLDYNNYCGYEADPTATSDPTETYSTTRNPTNYGPTLYAAVTPTSRTLYERQEYYYLSMRNAGSAPAWNIGYSATFGDAIELKGAWLVPTSSSVPADGTDITPADLSPFSGGGGTASWTFQTATDDDNGGGLTDSDGDGYYDDLAPGSASYILVLVEYTGYASADLKIQVAVEAGGELPPATAYAYPADIVATRPSSFCQSDTGSTGTLRMGPHAVQAIHVNPTLELCTATTVTFQAKNIQQTTIYEPTFTQYIPKDAGAQMDFNGAIFEYDADGDGTADYIDTLPGPGTTTTETIGGTEYDKYVWTYDQFPVGQQPAEMVFGASIKMIVKVWGSCEANGTTIDFRSAMSYYTILQELIASDIVSTNVTLLEIEAGLLFETYNESAGETAADFSSDPEPGGYGDTIQHRITVTNDGGAKAKAINLQLQLPTSFTFPALTDFSIQPNAALSDAATGKYVWTQTEVFASDTNKYISSGASKTITFAADLTGANVCANSVDSGELIMGCIYDPGSPFPDCSITTVTSTHTLQTEPTLDQPQIQIASTDLVTGDGDSDEIDTNGIITVSVTGKGGTARDPVLTATIPSGWLFDGVAATSFTGANGLDGYTLDNSDPTAPQFTFTYSGPVDPVLRDSETISLSFYVVQNSNFDTQSDLDTVPETTANYDPIPPADYVQAVSLDYTDTCTTTVLNAGESATLPVHTPDLDVGITDPISGDPKSALLSSVGSSTDVSVVVANAGENTLTENATLLLTLGDAIEITSGLAAFAGTQTIVSGSTVYDWVQVGVTNTYYLTKQGGGDPGLFEPTAVTGLSSGTLGVLTDNQWAWGDNDGLGFDTLYVDLAGGDPNSTDVAATVPAVTTVPAVANTRILVIDADGIGGGDALTLPLTVTVVSETAPLTLQAQVVGGIYNQAGDTHLGNYSDDSHAAALLGFHFDLGQVLTTTSEGGDSSPTVQVGEEVTYTLRAEWYGMGGETVSSIQLTDLIPAGYAFVSYAETGNNTVTISSGPTAPTTAAEVATADDQTLTWDLADVSTDQVFEVLLVLRVLNDPNDSDGTPIGNGTDLTTRMDASFTFLWEGFDKTSEGYPADANLEVTVTTTTPSISTTKQVRNVTTDTPTGAGNYADNVEAEVGDVLEYIVTVANGAGRGTAYDVVIVDTTSTRVSLVDPAGDGIDNDGDLSADESDEGASTSITGSTLEITFNATNGSDQLASLPGGGTVAIVYRVTVEGSAFAQHDYQNTAVVSADTLAGDSGGQTAATAGATGDDSGARLYSVSDSVTFTTPNVAVSKAIVDLSHTALAGTSPYAGTAQTAVIGEEVQYQLACIFPAAIVADVHIYDSLPTGLTAIEGGDLVIDADDADIDVYTRTNWDNEVYTKETGLVTATKTVGAFSFSPSGGGTISGTGIHWDLSGYVILFKAPATYTPTCIARVDNIAANQDGTGLDNTDASLLFYDEDTGSDTTLDFNDVPVTIKEPTVTIGKSISPDTSIDAGDVLTVTIQLQNTGNAPAYNVDVWDDLTGTGLTYSGSVGGTNPPDFAWTSAPGSNPAPAATPAANAPVFRFSSIPAGATRTFTFQVTVNTSVSPEQVVGNTVDLAYTSLPANTTALNTGGTIGTDGSATGMRNGQIDADGGLNDYEGNSTDSVAPVAVVTIAKTDQNPAVVPTIGALKHYRIVVTLPEGTTSSLTISDTLPTGLVFDTTPNAISYTLSRIASINGDTVLTDDALIATAIEKATAGTDIPADNATGTVAWNFGTVVTNTANGGSTTGTIQIDYYVRIANTAVVDAGLSLQNEATLTYTGQATPPTSQAPAITVVEPVLDSAKTVENVTSGKSAGDLPDAGDTLKYVVTVQHAGDSTAAAYDVIFLDTLDTQTEILLNTDGAPADPAVVFANGASGSLTASSTGDATLTGEFDIPLTGTATVTYYVRVKGTTEPSDPLDNKAEISWSSLDDAGDGTAVGLATGERTGHDVLGDSGGTLNDYYDVATISRSSVDSATIAKTHSSDTYGAGDTDVRVGDVITYDIDVTLPEGVSKTVVVTDALPTGLEFVDTVSILGDTAAPYSSSAPFTYADIAAGSTPTAGATGTLTWTLGDITNAGDNNTSNNTLTIVYRARVRDDVSISGTSNSQQNTATLNYKLEDGTAATPETDTETVTVKQPLLTVDKTSSPAAGSTDLVQGQTVTYTITVANTGAAPAYDVVIDDVIPVGMRAGGVAGINVTSITVNGSAVGSPEAPVATGTFATDGGIEWDLDDGVTADTYTINASNSLVLVYEVTVDSDIGPGVVMTNSASVEHYYSFDDDAVPTGSVAGDRLDYGSVGPDTVTLTIAKPGNLSKTATPTAVIGATITYEIKVPADGNTVNATMYDVEVTDVLPADVTYVSAVAGAGNLGTGFAASESGGTITVTFDTIPPSSQAVITVTATVDNVVANQNSTVLTNTASYVYERVDGSSENISGGGNVTADTTVKEPVLTVSMAISDPDPLVALDAGDTATYVLTIAHDGTSTADAFDAALTDLIDAGAGDLLITSITGTTLNGGATADSAAAITGGGTGLSGQYDIPSGGSVVITFVATVQNTVTPGKSMPNSASITWSSLDSNPAGARDGTDGEGGALDDYADSVSATVLSAPSTVGLAKTVSASTALHTIGTDLVVGETATFRVVATVIEGTTENVVLTDTMPAGLQFVPGTVSIAHAAGMTTQYTSEATNVTWVPATRVLTISIGNVLNPAGADPETITFEFDALVLNTSDNASGPAKTNSATLTATDTDDATATVAVNILEPVLQVSKTITPPDSGLESGDIVTYTIVVQHTAGSETDAFDVVITDLLDAGSQDIKIADVGDISVVTSDASVNEDSAPVLDGNSTGFSCQYDIPNGESVTITYTAKIQDTIQPGDTLTNDVDVAWSSLPGGLSGTDDAGTSEERTGTGAGGAGAENDYATTANDSFTTLAPTLGKSISGGTTYTIGETVTYQVVVNVPQGQTQAFVVHDTLPSNIAFVSTDSITNGNGVMTYTLDTATDPEAADTGAILWDFGTVSNPDNSTDDDTITIVYTVLVLNTTGNNAGDTRDNAAYLAYTDGGGNPQTTATDTTSFTIVEPAVTVDKVVQTTPSPVDAAGEIVYQVTLTNTSSATGAYDIDFTDTFPADLQYKAASLVHVSGTDITGSLLATSGGVTTAAGGFDLVASGTTTFEYTVAIQDTVNDGDSLTNDVEVTWTSLDGADANERTGSGVAPNDYAAADSETLTADLSYTLAKTINSTSFAGTADDNLTIGETVTFYITAAFGEGTTTAVSIVDNVPTTPGLLAIESASVVSVGGNLTVDSQTAVTSDTGADSYHDRATFTFGTVVNSGDNTADADDEIVVEVVARLVNIAENQSAETSTNNATLAVNATTVDASVTFNTVEPDLTITKTITSTPTTDLEAGDTVTYQLVIQHSGSSTANAYDVVLADVLDSASGDIVVTSIDSVATSGTVTADSAAAISAGNTGIEGQYDITLGGTLTITYTATLQTAAEPDDTLGSSASITWSSLDGNPVAARDGADGEGAGLNNYADSDTASVTTASPDLTKAVLGTPVYTIGETFQYRIVVSLNEGTTDNVVVHDTLPTDVAFVSATITDGNAGISYTLGTVPAATDTGAISWTFGTVVNPANASTADDTIQIDYTVRILNTNANQNDLDRTNRAYLAYDDGIGTGHTTTERELTFKIKEPQLSVSKAVTTPGTDAGDSVVYTITITNDTLANNASTAYDIVVTDTLESTLEYVSASATTAGIKGGSNVSANQAVELILDQLAPGATATVTVNAVLLTAIQPGETITNQANIKWSSLDENLDGDGTGTGTSERTGVNGGTDTWNDYTADSNIPQFTTGTPTIDKSDPSALTATIGETVTYTITVTFPEGTNNDIVVTDAVPAGMGYVTHSIDTSGFNGTLTKGTATDTIPVANTDGADLVLAWDTITVANDNVTTNNAFVINLELRVLNSTGNDIGDELLNTATMTYANPEAPPATITVTDPTAPAAVTIQEPLVTISKSAENLTHAAPALTEAGDIIEYTLTLTAASGANRSTAFDVDIVDQLGDYLVYDDTFTPTVSAGGIGAAVVSGGDGTPGSTQTLTWSLANGRSNIDMAAGDTVTVKYRAKVHADFADAYAITNDVTVYWSSIDGGLGGSEPGPDAGERTGNAGARRGPQNDYVTAAATSSLYTTFTLEKSVVSGSPAAIGDTVTYQLVLHFTQGTTNGVSITDVLPADMDFVPTTVSVSNATGVTTGYVSEASSVVVSGTPDEVTITLGSVTSTDTAPNNTVTIEYDVLVTNAASNVDGATKTNTATASATGVPDSIDTADTTIHEPALTVLKEFENITKCGLNTSRKLPAHRPQANDTLRFTVTLTNTSATATAYDVDLQDMVGATGGAWFDVSTLTVESATLNGVDQGAAFDSPSTAVGGPINWGRGNSNNSTIDIAPGETFEIVYTLDMDAGLLDGVNLTRDVVVDWTSVDGVDANERTDAGGVDDYTTTYTHTLYSFDSTPTTYVVPAGVTATLDADGNLDYDGTVGTDATLLGGEQITLNDGSELDVTGDGLPNVVQGYVHIYVEAGASATIRQTGDFVVDYLTMNGGGTLTIVEKTRAGPTINYGNLTMGVGDELVFPDDSTVLFGPAVITGSSGYDNLATIRPTTANGGLTVIFCCNTSITYGEFAGIAHGYVEFQGHTEIDHGLFTDGDGTNPYIKYVHPEQATWHDLAFRSDKGATTTIENNQTNADTSYWVEVDGYLGPTDNYIGGNSTDIEPAGTTDTDAISGVRWSNATPAYGVKTALSAPASGGVRVDWSAKVEIGVLKYQVQVADGNRWTTIGEVLARTEGIKGGTYDYLDRAAQPEEERTYRLVCVDVDGDSREYEIGKATAVAVAPVLETVREAIPTFPTDAAWSVEELTYTVQKHATETPAMLGTARKASVTAGGLYEVGNAGRVYNVGRELARIGGMVYVRPYSDPYTDTNVLWSSDEALTLDGEPGEVPAPAAQGELGPAGYVAIVHVEHDESLALNSMLPPGPNWFYGYTSRLAPGNAPILTVNVPAPASKGTATVKVAVRSTTDGDHDLGITVNGTAIGRATWAGSGHHMVEVQLDLSVVPLLDGDNQIQLWTTAAGSSKRLDYVEVHTPATPRLRDGSLVVKVLEGAPSTLAIDGANYAIDVTEFGNESPVSTRRGAISGLAAGQIVYLAEAATGTLDWSDPVDLTAIDAALAGKQYVAVAPSDWVDTLAPLIAKHEAEGLSCVAVSVEDVYDTYGGGLPTPAGLVRLGQRVKPEYLLIAAGASHDPKGLEGDLPAPGIATGFVHVEEGTASTDDLYTGDFSIAVGRLPARSQAELTNMVNKIIDFYPGRRAVMMADVDDSTMGYGSFAELQAELAEQLPSVLLDANTMNGAAMRTALIDAINDGANLVTYQGHGNNALIGDEFDILNTSHVSQVPPSAWLLATCLTGVYTLETEGTKVLASELLRTGGNGAVSVLASTCYGQAGIEHKIVEMAVREIAKGNATWGQILLKVKTTFQDNETAAIYTLLGDPAMRTLNPIDGDREIVIVSPVAGGFINAEKAPVVHFRLRGGWWRQSLEILWRRDHGEWVPLNQITIDPEVFDYTIPWDPPPEDGDNYQIMIREIIEESEVR